MDWAAMLTAVLTTILAWLLKSVPIPKRSNPPPASPTPSPGPSQTPAPTAPEPDLDGYVLIPGGNPGSEHLVSPLARKSL